MFKMLVDQNGNVVQAFPLIDGMVNLTTGTHDARGICCAVDGQVRLDNYIDVPVINMTAGDVHTCIKTTVTIISGKFHLA